VLSNTFISLRNKGKIKSEKWGEMVVNDHYNTLAVSEMGVRTHSQ